MVVVNFSAKVHIFPQPHTIFHIFLLTPVINAAGHFAQMLKRCVKNYRKLASSRRMIYLCRVVLTNKFFEKLSTSK